VETETESTEVESAPVEPVTEQKEKKPAETETQSTEAAPVLQASPLFVL
jgi:hypothetical protein